MKVARHWYFLASFLLSIGAIIYCVCLYRAGQYANLQLGPEFLAGVPNYYFFYTVILPFVAVGAIYIALENQNIRFFGRLNGNFSEKTKARMQRFRAILLFVAVLFSVLIAVQDSAEKSTSLPPYSFDLGAEQDQNIANFFACQKKWIDCEDRLPEAERVSGYLAALKANGYEGESSSGFSSFSQWLQQSSTLYKFESLLSWFAALIVGLLFAEVFLLMMVKNHVKAATKSLVIWLVVLVSLWLPTKMYSSWYANLGSYSAPAVLWFGIALLIVGIMLVVFLKTEQNDLYKVASVVAAIFSALISWISIVKPELIRKIVNLLRDAGIIYTSIFLLIVIFSLYLVTDHFMSNYEKEAIDDA